MTRSAGSLWDGVVGTALDPACAGCGSGSIVKEEGVRSRVRSGG